jgi:predicted NUDIX family NTP pyrophosphohydrolase
MVKFSAGILPYRLSKTGELEVFIVHPGGPFWAKKDAGAWSAAKGEYEESEDPVKAAEREFEEETGLKVPMGERVDLGEIRQSSGKRVRLWAVEATELSDNDIVSNKFDMEWPPKSGQMQSFPEVDRAKWVSASVARQKLVKGQVDFIDRLLSELKSKGISRLSEGTIEPNQQATLF